MIELLIGFSGYILGRIGDYFAGHWDFFHHWIYGFLFVVMGFLSSPYFIYFGVGLIISDFKDLLHFRIYGPDVKTKKNFWGFD